MRRASDIYAKAIYTLVAATILGVSIGIIYIGLRSALMLP